MLVKNEKAIKDLCKRQRRRSQYVKNGLALKEWKVVMRAMHELLHAMVNYETSFSQKVTMESMIYYLQTVLNALAKNFND
uniref:Uncharacterized protein n=1 Tax=Romanomermis culicivorax TaxID=13658 RepID=A0A915K5L5_ROMCU